MINYQKKVTTYLHGFTNKDSEKIRWHGVNFKHIKILYKCKMTKAILLISLCLLIVFVNFFFQPNLLIYPQSENIDVVKNDSWVSKQNNLNVTISLEPKVPVIDEKTSISFEVRKLNDSSLFENLSARVTLTDHDGRLFKFHNQDIRI